jgi:hypothetical protein
MFDNLREASEREGFAENPGKRGRRSRAPASRFLGLTAFQRLLLSFLFLGAVILISVMCLVVTGKVYL